MTRPIAPDLPTSLTPTGRTVGDGTSDARKGGAYFPWGAEDGLELPQHRGLRFTGESPNQPPRWTVAAKRRTLSVLSRFGILDAIRDSRWRQERLLILAYHSVSLSDEHQWSGQYSMPPAQFEARLRTLRDGGYNVISLDEGVRRLRERTLPPRSVVITFDDGLYDFSAQALPLLQKYGFPATVYFTSYYAEKVEPIFGLLCSYFLWRGRESHGIREAVGLRGDVGEWDLSTELGRARAHTALLKTAEHYSAAERAELLARLASGAGIDFNDFQRSRVLSLMSRDEIAALAAQGVDVQLHTHRHRMPEDRDLFLREIEENRAFVEPLRQSRARHFCYPSGEYSDQFCDWLERSDIVSATTCDPGLATARTEPLLLPRVVDTSSVSEQDFVGWLTGASAFFLPRKASAHLGRAR